MAFCNRKPILTIHRANFQTSSKWLVLLFLCPADGVWGTSACGNAQPFICKRKNLIGANPKPLAPLPGYPTEGSCPENFFKLGNMCYRFKGGEGKDKSWLDARDDCRNEFSGTLATVTNPGQQGEDWGGEGDYPFCIII